MSEDGTDAILDGLRNSFGRVSYSHKTHEKMADRVTATTKWLKRVEVFLLALTAGSALGVLLGDDRLYEVAVAVIASLSLLLTLYQYRFNPEDVVRSHQSTANKLWMLREEYCALMTDLRSNAISSSSARNLRDDLLHRLHSVYESAPRCDERAYKAAQRALQLDEELSFSEAELDSLLPKHLRTDSSNGRAS